MRLHGLLQVGLIAFDGQKVVAAVGEDDVAGGLRLGVQGIEADEPAGEFEPGAELAHGGDLVGFFRDDCAAQIVQAGGGDRGDDVLSAAVLGLFAVEDDEFGGGRAPRIWRWWARSADSMARAETCASIRLNVG